ncbi:MAG: FAD-dependent oxidoreductase [Bacteroidaceae bacterium]|nr:FAD-dependent oxidoreductase [Bacteroidaceae bacterium]
MRLSKVCFPVFGLLVAACSGGAPSDGTQLANGKYTADALNVESTITATVTVKGHKIAAVSVKDNGNTYAQYTSPYTIVPKRIVEAQSTDVDGVTGATYSSDAVKKAVDLALAQARGEKPVPAKNAALGFTPGTYTGRGKGYGGQMQARVTFSETGITGISVGQQRETAHVGDVAFQILPDKIIAANGLGVDAVSGATMSSFGLKEAVLDAADQAGVTNRKAFIENSLESTPGDPIDDTWDVVIIGGGGAGLCAAAQAAQDGSTVLIIEKNAELGGNTLVSGGVYQSVDHSLVWDKDYPTATSAKGFDGNKHNKVRATVGCVNDLMVIYDWSEEPFDADYYKDHEFVAGDIVELSKHGVHAEYLQTLKDLKKEIKAYLAYAEPNLKRGVPENQLTLFSTTNLHIFQTYYGGLRQNTAKDEWIYGDYDLVKQFIVEGEQLKPWLMKMGVGFSDSQSTLVGALWYRGNTMNGCTADADGDGNPERYSGNWGSYVMAPLAVVNNANKHNRVMRETSANELIFENGRVTGVKAKMADGTQVTAHAKKGVIIATGGYAANIQKVLKTNKYWSRQYLSPNIGTTNRSSLRGDGIDMAQKVGAATVGEGYTQLMPLAYIADGAIAFGGVENAIFISTKDGKRYVDECSERDVLSLNGFKHGVELEGRRGVYLYVMGGFGGFGGGFGGFGGGGFGGFGGGAPGAGNQNNASANVRRFNGRDWSGKGSELPELFEELGITLDAEVVKNSIREYDMAVMDGREPSPIGKRHATGIIGSARRGADGQYDKSTYSIDDANLSIRVLAPSTHHTMGGLKIDLDRRVLDENGKAIPGLYAAGEVTGGFFGGNRLGGNALTECMASGRIAAKGVEKDN